MSKSYFEDVLYKVYAILTDSPLARDSDRVLITDIWKQESQALSLGDFFADFTSGKISHPESITRARRKIQEKHAELRGEKWESRHEAQAEMYTQLNNFKGFPLC